MLGRPCYVCTKTLISVLYLKLSFIFCYHLEPAHGWGKTTRTLAPLRQVVRYPTRNECMGWFAQI